MQTPPESSVHSSDRQGTLALLAAFGLETALLLAAAGAYKLGGTHGTVWSGPGFALACGLALGASAAILLVRQWRHSSASGRRAMRLALAANVVLVVFVTAVAEFALRLAATETSEGIAIGPARLPPNWAETRARNARLVREAGALGQWWDTFFVADPLLGWTAGPDRRSSNGLYYSSAEGIRSAGPGVAFARQPAQRRIALVGDSYTFSMDVSWQDSWAHHLQQRLGPDVQVLNFGIDGYGIDQAYLRYQRDVRPWQPQVVIFGVIQHDLTRTLAVYPFISFGWGFPFAKPRFALETDGIRLLNTPLIGTDEIIAAAQITDLPFIEYDLGYQQSDWRWRRDRAPLLLRLWQAAVPRWPPADPRTSTDTAIALSGRLLQRFSAEATAAGSVLLVVYFPTRGAGDFAERPPAGRNITREMLAAHAPAFHDLTDCVRAVPPGQRFVTGATHYAGAANAAVAQCVAVELEQEGLVGAGGGT